MYFVVEQFHLITESGEVSASWVPTFHSVEAGSAEEVLQAFMKADGAVRLETSTLDAEHVSTTAQKGDAVYLLVVYPDYTRRGSSSPS
jgi:hypothetical protein